MPKKFSFIGKFTKKNIEEVPADKPIVYRIKGSSGDYVGIAKKGRVPERLKEHLPGAKDATPGAKSFSIKQMSSLESAEKEEKRIIKNEHPKYNEQE